MMAMSEDRDMDRLPSLKAIVLPVLLSVPLGVVALFGLNGLSAVAKALIATDTVFGPWPWQTALLFGKNLLMFLGGALGVLWLKPWKAIRAVGEAPDEDGPETLKITVLSMLFGFLALLGLSAAVGTVAAVLFDPHIQHPVNPLTWGFLAWYLLVGGGGIWGLVRLKPWTQRGPLSPSMRRTNALFGLSGLVATASCLLVIFGTMSSGDPFALFSNSPVALWIAIAAIALWLLSWAIAWWWYFSADEHEQRASDVGLLVGGLLFAVVTPAWWVAARAGLLPQPNAMILWAAVNLVWTAGWFWRRSR